MRILLVEDDVHLASSLTEILTTHRYAVDTVKDGEAGWEHVKVQDYDLILLDITLPKLDGVSLCRRLRDHNCLAPVLMLTARDTSRDKVLGLDSGADAYMVKPFDLSELLAQIRALLRRGGAASTPILRWGGLYLDPSSYEVTYNQQPLRLTPKEFSLLEILLRNGKRVLNRVTLIDHVWSWQNSPEEETVKTHIKSLRAKLKAAGAPKDFIETVHGLGYRLKSL